MDNEETQEVKEGGNDVDNEQQHNDMNTKDNQDKSNFYITCTPYSHCDVGTNIFFIIPIHRRQRQTVLEQH